MSYRFGLFSLDPITVVVFKSDEEIFKRFLVDVCLVDLRLLLIQVCQRMGLDPRLYTFKSDGKTLNFDSSRSELLRICDDKMRLILELQQQENQEFVGLDVLSLENTNSEAVFGGAISLLMMAAFLGNVKMLNTSEVDENSKDSQGRNILHFAVLGGSLDYLELILKKIANVNVPLTNGRTALHLACLLANFDAVKLLLESKAKIDACDSFGATPLCYASSSCSKCALYLIEQGADKTITDARGQNAVHYASFREGADVIAALGKEYSCDKRGQTPLHVASFFGQAACVDFLLENSNPNVLDVEGKSALHRAASQGHLEVARLLLTKRAGVNQEDQNGETPLHAAAFCGFLDLVKLLLENGANLELRSKKYSSIHFACRGGNLEILKLFIELGENVNALSSMKQTPLHFAAGHGKEDVLKLLLHFKADVNAKDSKNQTPIHFACSKGNFECLKLLVEAGADLEATESVFNHTALHLACWGGSVECIRFLMKKKANLNAVDFKNCSALHLAADAGHVDAMRVLVEEGGADVNCKDSSDHSPLHYASAQGHIECALAVCMDYTFNLKTCKRPFKKGYKECIRYLVQERKADVNCVTQSNSTPLHYAIVAAGHVRKVRIGLDCVKSLVDFGANIKALNRFGTSQYSCLFLALRLNDIECVMYLLELGAIPTDSKGRRSNGILDRFAQEIKSRHVERYAALLKVILDRGNFDTIHRIVVKDLRFLLNCSDSNDTAVLCKAAELNNPRLMEAAFSPVNDEEFRMKFDETAVVEYAKKHKLRRSLLGMWRGKGNVFSVIWGWSEASPGERLKVAADWNDVDLMEDVANEMDINSKINGSEEVLNYAIRTGRTNIIELLQEMCLSRTLRVMFVGNEGSGKTHLKQRILRSRYVAGATRLLEITNDTLGKGFRVRMFDFAGQAGHYAAQNFFIGDICHERLLTIMCIDVRKENSVKKEEICTWMDRMVQSNEQKALVCFVATHCDVNQNRERVDELEKIVLNLTGERYKSCIECLQTNDGSLLWKSGVAKGPFDICNDIRNAMIKCCSNTQNRFASKRVIETLAKVKKVAEGKSIVILDEKICTQETLEQTLKDLEVLHKLGEVFYRKGCKAVSVDIGVALDVFRDLVQGCGVKCQPTECEIWWGWTWKYSKAFIWVLDGMLCVSWKGNYANHSFSLTGCILEPKTSNEVLLKLRCGTFVWLKFGNPQKQVEIINCLEANSLREEGKGYNFRVSVGQVYKVMVQSNLLLKEEQELVLDMLIDVQAVVRTPSAFLIPFLFPKSADFTEFKWAETTVRICHLFKVEKLKREDCEKKILTKFDGDFFWNGESMGCWKISKNQRFLLQMTFEEECTRIWIFLGDVGSDDKLSLITLYDEMIDNILRDKSYSLYETKEYDNIEIEKLKESENLKLSKIKEK